MHAAHPTHFVRTFVVRPLIALIVLALILIEPAYFVYLAYARYAASDVAAFCRDVKLPELSTSAPR